MTRWVSVYFFMTGFLNNKDFKDYHLKIFFTRRVDTETFSPGEFQSRYIGDLFTASRFKRYASEPST